MRSYLSTVLFGLICLTSGFAQTWEAATGIPGGNRHHPICFAVDDTGYLLCGNADPGQSALPYLNDFYSYNAEDDTWTKLPDFPGVARGFGVGLSYNGKGYIGFGYGDNRYLDDLWEYDPITEIWTQLPSCPCAGRTHPAFLAAEGKIYVGLGGTGRNAKDWWSYDLPSGQWTQEQDFLGKERHHPYYFTVDDIPYVGFGHSSSPTVIHNDFFKFDPSSRAWEQLKDFPSHGKVAGTHFDLNGKGYILAGDGGDHGYDEGEFWEYEPESDSWLQLPTFPEDGRWAPGAFVINEKAYFTSGYARNTGVYHSDLWSYNLAITTSDEEVVEFDQALVVFPNPASNYTMVNGLIAGEDYILINVEGKVVEAFKADSDTYSLQVSHLKGGVYWLRNRNLSDSKGIPIIKP